MYSVNKKPLFIWKKHASKKSSTLGSISAILMGAWLIKVKSAVRFASSRTVSWSRLAEKKRRRRAGSLHSCLHFLSWSRGSEWPSIWICRPSTGQRRSHLLFLKPTWKKKGETETKKKKITPKPGSVNVCMPWVCCFCLFPCTLALINACQHQPPSH